MTIGLAETNCKVEPAGFVVFLPRPGNGNSDGGPRNGHIYNQPLLMGLYPVRPFLATAPSSHL